MAQLPYTVPGMSQEDAAKVIEILQKRLASYNDLHLTLKHVHWNVVGRNFIGVHEMIDPQVELVRGWADQVAERIATLGGSPDGRVCGITKVRDWDDYPKMRDSAMAHLRELDEVYVGVISSNREAFEALDGLDLVTQDMIIAQTDELEKFQWFIRAHLEEPSGDLDK